MECRPAPYPADTRAKGWRFELDHERIRQSDTWALASADARPWLLMLWMVAWEQTPCGSLPADDELIAARIGMAPKLFAKHRAVLLRGWWAASDGRLYHNTLAARALEMIASRGKNAKRVAEWKASKREQQAGNALPTGEQHGENDTGTGTGTGIEDYGAKAPASSAPELRAEVSICVALKQHGVPNVSASHPRLMALCEAGATEGEFLALLPKAQKANPGDPFPYLLGAVEGERKRAKTTGGQLHRGPLQVVSKQQAIEDNNRKVAAQWAATGAA